MSGPTKVWHPDELDSQIENWLKPGVIGDSPSATVRPPVSTKAAMDALQALGVEPSALDGRLDIRRQIAQGGMALVQLGHQVALDRDVAVKMLRKDRLGDNDMSLLREAWILGALEHPNVVPIYDIAIDTEGTPLVVMRHIDGTDWGKVISNKALAAESFEFLDFLEWNIRTLMQVCRAAHFAHSRGIVHRDLKPQNVMIGAFGEVYVVDWGISVALEGGHTRLNAGNEQLAGTPCYMAPEMLAGRIDAITPKTDIYLLGAILYEILSGAAPHRAKGLPDVFQSVRDGISKYPEDAPAELVEILPPRNQSRSRRAVRQR